MHLLSPDQCQSIYGWTVNFSSHFPNGSGLAGIRTSPFWIMLELRMMEVVVTSGVVRHAKKQSDRHHRQTNTQFTNSVRAPKENVYGWTWSWNLFAALQGGIWCVPVSDESDELQLSAAGACQLQLLLKADILQRYRCRRPVCRQTHRRLQSSASACQAQGSDTFLPLVL